MPRSASGSQALVTVSGYRGVVGTGLTAEEALRYTAAFGSWLPPGPVVLGRDSRPSGAMLARAVSAALLATGHDVIEADILPTPSLGVLVDSLQAAGGVMVTASHNPPEYNGLKLFVREPSTGQGRVLTAEEGRQVKQRYHQGQFAWHDALHTGTARCENAPWQEHLRRVLATVGAEQIRRRRFRVLLDANGGAGGPAAVELLGHLGCDVVCLGCEPTGRFDHPPEPTAENLRRLGPRVVEHQCELGFCLDPDADRLALLDHQGRYVGEEYTLALCAWHRLEQQPGPLATNCATSQLLRHLARRYDVPLAITAVGEANVVQGMLRTGAVYGGEGNGGPIDPRVGLVRDSLAGMAQVLDLLAQRQQSLAQVVAQLPPSFMVKQVMPLAAERLPQFYWRLQEHFAEATASRPDGLRLDWPQKWLLVRPSNTEPVVRLIAEAPSAQEAQALVEQARQLAPGEDSA